MDIFTAVAESTRRDIIELLASKGELSATAISKKFPSTPSAISQHLKVLREANVIQMQKHAQQRIYQINPEKIHELEEWAQKMGRFWNERFDRLDKVLEEEKRKLNKY